MFYKAHLDWLIMFKFLKLIINLWRQKTPPEPTSRGHSATRKGLDSGQQLFTKFITKIENLRTRYKNINTNVHNSLKGKARAQQSSNNFTVLIKNDKNMIEGH